MLIQILEMSTVSLFSKYKYIKINDVNEIDKTKDFIIVTRNPYHCENKDKALQQLKDITTFVEHGNYCEFLFWQMWPKENLKQIVFRYEDCLINLNHVNNMLSHSFPGMQIAEEDLRYADKLSFVTEQDALQYWGYV